VKSPTVSQEAIFLKAMIDAHENRDVMSGDVPNAFIQTTIPNVDKAEQRIIMKITGVLVDCLVDIAPEQQLYGPCIVFEDGKKVLYLQDLQALYGMLIAALFWFNQLRKDLTAEKFEFDPC
jgi:hypothetical protein